jgi:hypothetical protein
MDDELIKQIQNATFLQPADKFALVNNISRLSALDKLKLKHAFSTGQAQVVEGILSSAINKTSTPPPPKKDLLSQLGQKFFGASDTPAEKKPDKKTIPPPEVVSNTILSQPAMLGGEALKAIPPKQISSLVKIGDLSSLDQLRILAPIHISFDLDENSDLEIQNFIDKSSELFESIKGVEMRRNYFLNFISSPLFSSYMNTGLTAMRHPELQPASVVLNTLYQIDNKYLNNKQFRTAATICHHLRSLSGI